MSAPRIHLISCTAPAGKGGLGRHVTELSLAVGGGSTEVKTVDRDTFGKDRPDLGARVFPFLARYSPLRFSPGWLNFLNNDLFDHSIARRLPGRLDEFTGFGGQALHSARRARGVGCVLFSLVAANSHVRNVRRRHAEALRRCPVETSWLNAAQVEKTLLEYRESDKIWVGSEYTRQSFLAEGVEPSKLQRFPFTAHPRFSAPERRERLGSFRVVYTGSLTVMKGIPVLIEAFSALRGVEAELILVGGSATRGMNRYVQAAVRGDGRIMVRPGDPLPWLQDADVYVHPSFEDGFAYAPMEALACKVPVVVSEDTGMKEHVQEGVNGYVVPTGQVVALTERLDWFIKNRGALAF